LGAIGSRQHTGIAPVPGKERPVRFGSGGLDAADGRKNQNGQDGDSAKPAHSARPRGHAPHFYKYRVVHNMFSSFFGGPAPVVVDNARVLQQYFM
jgi:hypothetical protein